MKRYSYLTGKEIEPQEFIMPENPYKNYHCEKCGRKTGNIHSVGMDLTIFGYMFLCTECANERSKACMKSCPSCYGYKDKEDVEKNAHPYGVDD